MSNCGLKGKLRKKSYVNIKDVKKSVKDKQLSETVWKKIRKFITKKIKNLYKNHRRNFGNDLCYMSL